jgi:cell wall-associated NlpC family hydrolase
MRPILQHLQSTRVVTVVAVIATSAFTSLASLPANAPATPLASKQAAARQLDAQVSKLERQYDELQERYRGAEIELESVQADVLRARQGVAGTRKNLGRAKVRLRDRAITIYQTGGSGTQLVDLAVSGSFSGLFDRIDAVRRVGSQDANVLTEVEDLNQRMVAKQARLTTALAKQSRVVARAKRDKNHMQKLRDQRQAKLDSVNADIRQIMEAQRAAAERAAAARAQETAALANTAEAPGAGGSSSGGDGSSSSGGSSSGITVPLPPGSSTAAAAASAAMGKLGSPYVWAAAGPNAFDCSGLVVWAFAQAGRSGLPHSTYSLVGMGVNVPLDQLQVGDLVFPSGTGHVGIYVGNGSFVHAPHTGDVVKVTSLSDYPMQTARRL